MNLARLAGFEMTDRDFYLLQFSALWGDPEAEQKMKIIMERIKAGNIDREWARNEFGYPVPEGGELLDWLKDHIK